MGVRDARIEIIEALQTIKGIRSAPTKIPEGSNPFPFAIAHLATGVYQMNVAGMKLGLHNIMVEVHVGRDYLPYDYDAIEPLCDTIVNKWFYMLKRKGHADGFQYIEHFETIDYSLEPGLWANVKTLVLVFVLTNCKIQDAV